MKSSVFGSNKSKWILVIEYILSVVGITFLVKMPADVFGDFMMRFFFPAILFLISILLAFLYFIFKRNYSMAFWKWKRNPIPTEYMIHLPFRLKTVQITWNRKRHRLVLCILSIALLYSILNLVNPGFPLFISYAICAIPLWIYGNLQLALLSVVPNNSLFAQVLLLIPVLFFPFTIHYVLIFFTMYSLLYFLFPNSNSQLEEE